MRNRHIVYLALLLLVCLRIPASAQRHYSNLPRVADEVERKIRQVMPEWECYPIQPGALPPPGATAQPPGDDKLKIQRWDTRLQRVIVQLARYESQDEAVEAIHRYARYAKGKQIQGLGDEAYVYRPSGDIVFRAGNILVYVNAMVPERLDPAAGINDHGDVEKAKAAVAATLARGFAHHVAAALSTL